MCGAARPHGTLSDLCAGSLPGRQHHLEPVLAGVAGAGDEHLAHGGGVEGLEIGGDLVDDLLALQDGVVGRPLFIRETVGADEAMLLRLAVGDFRDDAA